jgi:L-ascorbate metabolism protein UlaG (beta-lactamase superfamily)
MANGALTWLGHASFRLDTPGGKRIYVDPWLDGNPSCPEAELEPERCDIVAITHGHSDHTGSAAALGKQFQPRLVAMNELAYVLEEQHGYPNASSGGMNKGGTVDVDGIEFTMTNAFHSSSFDGVYTGEPAGIVITLENGGTAVYFAGDTTVFGDMELIGRLYQPSVAVIPIGDHYTMGPREAAVALELLGAKRCVPCHWGTFPLLTGTPEALRELAPDSVEIVDVEPGGTIEL